MEWSLYATIFFTMIHCCVRTTYFMHWMADPAVQISPQATDAALERVSVWDSITFQISFALLFLSIVLLIAVTFDQLTLRMKRKEPPGFDVIQ
jgi:hypothetical protein